MARPQPQWVLLVFFAFILITRVQCFTSVFGHEFKETKDKKPQKGRRLTTARSVVSQIQGTHDTTYILDQVSELN